MQLNYLCTLLSVFDMERSLDFYCNILGFTIFQSAGPEDDIGWAWLKSGGLDLMLNTTYEKPQRPTIQDKSRNSAHADTILYFGSDDVDAAWRELVSKGIAANEPETTTYGMRQVYLTDPDGYKVCLQATV